MKLEGDYEEREFIRTKANFKNLSSRFELKCRDFKMQYASLYKSRYEKCLPLLRKRVDELWGSDGIEPVEICNLQCGVRSVVLGIIFKVMPKQPSILREISENIPEDASKSVEEDHFCSPEDSLVVEDLRQRVAIRPSSLLNVSELVTGVPIALMGSVDEEDARFVVEKVAFIGIQNIPPVPKMDEDKYIVFISGLNLSDLNDLTPMQLFVDYLTGMIGDNKVVEKTSKVCKVIICGNSVASRSNTASDVASFSLRKEVPDNAPYMTILDAYLNVLTKSVPVDVMPGPVDPANSQLPQQPLNQVLFPKSAVNTYLNAVTNPYEFEVDGIKLLGTSGQNITDILRYSTAATTIEALKSIVKWAHLIPTAPDTTSTYPLQDSDPFVIESAPHVLFAGDQKEFACDLYEDDTGKSVVLLSIPAFHKEQCCVWLNLKTLEAKKMEFVVEACPST